MTAGIQRTCRICNWLGDATTIPIGCRSGHYAHPSCLDEQARELAHRAAGILPARSLLTSCCEQAIQKSDGFKRTVENMKRIDPCAENAAMCCTALSMMTFSVAAFAVFLWGMSQGRLFNR